MTSKHINVNSKCLTFYSSVAGEEERLFGTPCTQPNHACTHPSCPPCLEIQSRTACVQTYLQQLLQKDTHPAQSELAATNKQYFLEGELRPSWCRGKEGTKSTLIEAKFGFVYTVDSEWFSPRRDLPAFATVTNQFYQKCIIFFLQRKCVYLSFETNCVYVQRTRETKLGNCLFLSGLSQ